MAVGTMSLMSEREGDFKMTWDTEKPEEVEAARQQFNSLRAKGYTAYSVERRGNKGEQMREFDPDAAAIILAPQLRGG